MGRQHVERCAEQSPMALDARALASDAVAPKAANPLLAGPILPTLLRLTLPNLAAMLVTALVAIAETAYVGILGTTQLAAIALVFPMVMLMQMLSAGAMGGGVSSAISRALGAGDEARAEALALHATVIGAVAGSAFSAAVRRLRARHISGARGPRPVLEHALTYANVALAGAVLIWLLNTLASVVRGTGNMRVPSLTLLGAASLQIGLGGAWGSGWGRSLASVSRASPRAWSIGFTPAPCSCCGFCDRARHGSRSGSAASASGAICSTTSCGWASRRLLAVADGAHRADPDRPGGALRHPGARRLRHRCAPRIPPGTDHFRHRRRQRADGGHGDRRRRRRPRASGWHGRRRASPPSCSAVSG